jgi:hypothetical protein
LVELRGRGFYKLNQALLTLLPKHADASQLGDYRSIGLIHLVAKIFTKLLSLRRAPKLNDIVSPLQNAFIRGRSLHDSFVLVRQSVRLLQQFGALRVLLKLDLARAFDSLSWPFLFDVLRRTGFGDRFISWLAILFSSATTKVLLNGEPGLPIWHRRGLCQGDPLSPQLFDIAVDILGKLFKRAVDLGVLQHLHPRCSIPSVSLYTDDVILFCHPTVGDIVAVKGILRIFGGAFGLQVNYAKCTATIIRALVEDTMPILEPLGCPLVDFPLTYLGIPLTIRRTTSA